MNIDNRSHRAFYRTAFLFLTFVICGAATPSRATPTSTSRDPSAPAPTALPPGEGPRYTTDGKLIQPEDYRSWVYLTSGVGMSYGPAAAGPRSSHPPFDNVFVQRSAHQQFLSTGRWPDKTLFVLEIRGSATHGSINKNGHFQTEVLGLEAAVQDSARYPERWAYFSFNDATGALLKSAAPQPKESCFRCHHEHGAVDHTFVQFYPTLIPVAEQRGTLSPTYVAPITEQRFLKVLRDDGLQKAEALYRQALRTDPQGPLSDEATLNRLGYQLLGAKRASEAATVLRLAFESHAASANLSDSLSEAYEAAGDRSRAVATAEQTLKLVDADKALAEPVKAALRKSASERIKRLGKS